jgi:PAS domain S-box-containing protein
MSAPRVDGFIEQDARGVISGWSAESEQLFGWTRAEAIGMQSRRLIPERNRATHDHALETFLAMRDQPIRRQQVTALHKDGHEFRAEFAISVEGSGDTSRVIAVVRAIATEAKAEAEAAFRQSERFRAILDQIEDGCCVVDLRGNYLFVNDAFCRLYGFDKAEILGSNFKQSSGPERAGKLREMYNQVYTTGQPIKAFEYQIFPKNRPALFVEQSISLEHDAQGRAVGFLAITRDCTARKLAEEAMARAKEAAEAANRAKSEFLANMSHEIRTPLNGIIGMTELALDTSLSLEQREYLTMVKSSADALLSILNDILDFSKIEMRKLELESIPFSVRDHLAELLKPLALRAEQKGLEVVCHVLPDVPSVMVGDPGRLRQVIVNLVGNAIKFTERGQVLVQVELDSTGREASVLHYFVSDSGIGIPKDKQQAVFEPFKQADGSTTRKFGGTGLGLTISAHLVRMIGGRIWLESEAGRGSRFHFTGKFEIRPDSTGSEPEHTLTAPDTRTLNILLADDNPVNQSVVMRLLGRHGHKVVVAGNGKEAVESAARQRFDVILMDVQMPVMSGLEAAAILRQREVTDGARTPIIAT